MKNKSPAVLRTVFTRKELQQLKKQLEEQIKQEEKTLKLLNKDLKWVINGLAL